METLDIRGLPKSKVERLKQLIIQWRRTEKAAAIEEEDIVFSTHDSNVIGSLRRREIYEDV